MNRFKTFLPYIEAGVVYSLLFFILWDLLPSEIIPYIFIFIGILFSLFYGLTGMMIALVGFLAAIAKIHNFILNPIAVEEWLIAIIGMLLFFMVGNQTSSISRELDTQLQANDMAQKRIKELFSQLVSVDTAHKKSLSEQYFRVDRPSYVYHELGKLSQHFNDEMQLFAKLFSLLYRHQFVEGGMVYKYHEYVEYPANYVALFRYGVSTFPDTIELKDAPEWFKLLQIEKQIISPKVINNKFIISIPIVIKPSDKMQYIIVVERIRQTMISEQTNHSLKTTALIIRFILEEQVYLANRQDYSMFKHIMVFKPGVAERILKERLELFEKAQLPYILTYWNLNELPEELEKVASRIHNMSRQFDEQFVIGEKLFILFVFTDQFAAIKARFKNYYPTIELQEVTNANIKQLISRDDFLSLGN